MKDQITKSNFIIIFVDDEEKSVKYFERIFGTEFRIIGTTQPETVLDIIADYPQEIAAIISDQRMPKINGVDLLSAVKEKNSNIIRILTTAYADLDDNISAINKSNVFAYLTKPWDIQQVFQTLRRALGEYSNRLNYLSLSGSIAHEMRNPLNSVRQSTLLAKEKLNLANLKEKFCCDDDENKITPLNKKEFVEIIESLDIAFSSAKRGNILIDIILDSIKQKSVDAKSFQKFSVSKVLNLVMQEYSFSDEERSRVVLDIAPEHDFEIKCNDTLLSYIFFNLLKNSLYYSKSHPNLTIGIRSEVGKDEFNRIYFLDNGPGIPQNRIDNLFEAFSSAGKEGGTGLGLAFCKKTMSNFGGAISCISKEGEFCEFILAFPKPTGRNEKERDSILLVDDFTKKLSSQKEFFSKNLVSTKVEIARNFNDAISSARQNKYAAIVVEIDYLESDKINLAKKVHEFDRSTPVIAYFDDDKFMRSELDNLQFCTAIRKKLPLQNLLKSVSKWGLINLGETILTMEEIKDLLRNKKILLADDENVNLILTAKYLEQFSVETDEVRDGDDALKIAKTKKYDLILMDIKMPELDGISAVKRIRENEQKNNLKAVPIIAFTGDNDREKIHEILNCKFDDYFIKGSDYRDLVESMALLLKRGNA